MSNNILKSVAVIVLGVVAGYSAMTIVMSPLKNRQVASSYFGKLGSHTNTRSILDVKISSQDIAKSDSDISILQARVTAMQNLNAGLAYQWIVPQDVQVLDSPIIGDLGAFSVNEEKQFEIRVRGFSKQQQKYLIFQISGEHAQRPLKLEILVPSRKEDSFEYQIQQNEKNNSSNKLNGFGDTNKRNKFDPANVVQ